MIEKVRLGMGLALAFLLVIMPCFSSLEISKTEVVEEINLSKENTKIILINIKNLHNQTVTVNLTTSDASVVEPAIPSVPLSSNETEPITFIIKAYEVGVRKATVTLHTSPDIGTYKINFTVVGVKAFAPEEVVYLEPSVSTFIMTLQQGTKTSRTISVRNVGSKRIEIKDIQTIGTTETPEGEKPISVAQADLGWLEPGKDLTFTINIDTHKVEPGTYTPQIKIIGYVDVTKKVETTINFNIKVTKSVEAMENKTIRIAIFPSSPTIGDLIYLVAYGENNQTIVPKYKVEVYNEENNKISEFIYTTPFKIENPGKYCIVAEKEGYKTARKCFNITLKEASLIISPSNPTEADTVVVKYVDRNNELIENPTISVDGHEYSDNPLHITLSSGNHTIKASAKGYKEISKKIFVEPRIDVYLPKTEYTLGEEVEITFSKNTSYKIKRNSIIVKQGTGNQVKFKPDEEGTYYIYVRDKSLASFEVKQNRIIALIYEYWWLLVIIGGIVVIIRTKGKGERYSRTAIGYAPTQKGPVRDIEGKEEF